MTPPRYTHLFFDIGGVLGTNGWDREQREAARRRFALDDDFDHRHHEVVNDWERGALSFDEYLDVTVFYQPRPFSREEFVAFMEAQSRPFPESIALVRRLAARSAAAAAAGGDGPVLMTLNNEALELNVHRIETFGLRDLFAAFLSSCWLGVRKPGHEIFRRALGIAAASPPEVLFIDDREQNLAPARALGFDTVHFTGAAALEAELARRGLL
jgi:putative hydrolase of the HAD superfamily